MTDKEKYMSYALKQAQKALEIDEVPIGAVIVKNGKIISRAYNKRELKKDSTCHAEILAIQKACKKLNNWRLTDCDLYVTCEPCPMCAGAIINSRIRNLYFGTNDVKSGAVVSKFNLLDEESCNHRVSYEGGILKNDCMQKLKEFFKKIRSKSNNTN